MSSTQRQGTTERPPSPAALNELLRRKWIISVSRFRSCRGTKKKWSLCYRVALYFFFSSLFSKQPSSVGWNLKSFSLKKRLLHFCYFSPTAATQNGNLHMRWMHFKLLMAEDLNLSVQRTEILIHSFSFICRLHTSSCVIKPHPRIRSQSGPSSEAGWSRVQVVRMWWTVSGSPLLFVRPHFFLDSRARSEGDWGGIRELFF